MNKNSNNFAILSDLSLLCQLFCDYFYGITETIFLQ